jgi:two-component system, cell cycle sensor histidine kinase and response regulator CckA
MGAGRYVLLEVVDTGCGMTPEVRERIFEPFFTTKSAGHGTGLGLATVYGILRQSGGHVIVQSAPGQGSTFRVFLPPAGGARGNPSQPQAAVESPRGAETVLVVEDEEAVRALARRILERQGYTVLDARNGEAALVLVRSMPGRRIDLLVTDMVMPGMNGRALAEAMVATRPDVRVLFMSGYTDDEIVRRGLRDADVSLLQKPFTADGLACAVRAALAPVS